MKIKTRLLYADDYNIYLNKLIALAESDCWVSESVTPDDNFSALAAVTQSCSSISVECVRVNLFKTQTHHKRNLI